MKKKRLLIGMILSLVVCLCLGLVCACGDKNADASEQRKVYNAYVAATEAAGEEPLSYEDWLKSIRGDKGDKGDKGDPGDPGKDGKSAFEIWQENGHEDATEDDFIAWLKGAAGKSAFEVWLEDNPGKSEDDFFADLKGDKGDDGKSAFEVWKDTHPDGTEEQWKAELKGEKGDDGKSAFDLWLEDHPGKSEDDFFAALKGDKGEQGQKGETGEPGAKGETGATGEKGDTGDKGDTGASAFDIFKKYYPYYTGTEQEWITELATGGLKIIAINFVDKTTDDTKTLYTWYGFAGRELPEEVELPEVPNKEGQKSSEWNLGGATLSDIATLNEKLKAATDTTPIEIEAKYEMNTEVTITFHYVYTDDGDVTVQAKTGEVLEAGKLPHIPEKLGNRGYWDFDFTQKITEGFTTNALYETKDLAFTAINGGQEYSVGAGSMDWDLEELFVPATHAEGDEAPKPVTTIAPEGFKPQYDSYPYTFTTMHLPESITMFSSGAFTNCQGIESITIPEEMTSIASSTFKGCIALENVTMPNVTELGKHAFYGCTALASIDLSKITSIGESTFEGCTLLAAADMPLVTSIGTGAFNECEKLATVKMPSVKTIGEGAFKNCTTLNNVEIPDGVTTIEQYTFQGCNGLKRIVLPAELTSIGDSAFNNAGLIRVFYKGDADTWDLVKKDNAGTKLKEATIYFYRANDPVSEEGNFWHYDADTPKGWDE